MKYPLTITDAQLKEMVKKDSFNGRYAHKICRGCGVFWISQDSITDNAKIVLDCDSCRDTETELT